MTTEGARRLADGLLLLALVALTFLLGCQELFDADVWWHLRAGRWILEHRSLPRLDPFTYGSAGRPWIDLHWTFQVALALAYAAGGVPGMILLASAGVATAIVVGLSSRLREWPAWVVAAGWLPGVLLASTRFDPRPEIVTIIGLCAFFGILIRARGSPGWLWLLVPIQLLWVNAHGLFVLGPWMLGLFLADRALKPVGQPPWRHLVPPSLAVGAACLANPYGMRGVLFPLELFPKLTEGGGSYKSYIGEFMSPRMIVETYWAPVPGHDLYLRLFVFLLAALPLVILVPAVWRAWAAGSGGEGPSRECQGAWVGVMFVAWGLALAVALGLPSRTLPTWRTWLGRAAPWLLAASGLLAAPVLARRSRLAAALAVAGAGATAGWVVWLVGHLFSTTPGLSSGNGIHIGPIPGAAAIAIGLGLPSALLALRAGTRPFGPLLAASFAFLALLSVRNMSLFGIVAGAVLAAESGAWAARLRAGRGQTRATAIGDLVARFAVLGAIGLFCAAVVTGRFYATAEDCHRFGLRERPFYYAHDACRFAGGPGLPDRALVFGLNQAGVYVFHNGPARKVFIDGRLEVASREVFERYAQLHRWLNDGDPRWANVARRMGNPLILFNHEENAPSEATVLADPRWRCIYMDAAAGVFLPRDRDSEFDRARDLERTYPTIDFARRHFDPRRAVGRAGAPRAVPGSALAESRALLQIGAGLAHRPAPPWSLRIPVCLVAMDLAREALDESPGAAGPRMALGNAALALAPTSSPGAPPNPGTPRSRGPGPAAPWDPAVGLPWAQANALYRVVLQDDPGYEPVRHTLALSFALLGMDDARHALEPGPTGAGPGSGNDVSRGGPTAPPIPWPGEEHLLAALDDLLSQGRPAAAVATAEEARRRVRSLPWPVAERIACAYMHLGEPALARRTWLEAASPPSSALRAARLADTDFAAWDLDAAESGYREAVRRDAGLADAWVGLALVALERGRAGEALAAARAALQSPAEPEPDPRRRDLLEGIASLTEPYAR